MYLKYSDVNNLYGYAMSQNLPVNGFKWVENTPEFIKDFISSGNGGSKEGHFLEVDVQYLEELHELLNDLLFLLERMKIEKLELTCMIKRDMLFK